MTPYPYADHHPLRNPALRPHHAAPKSDSIGTKGCSAATTQNVRDVTGMRSSARSAVSIDARDSLQPVDHAGRAAMAREGMLQLVVVVEAFWPNAGCTRPVTRTTQTVLKTAGAHRRRLHRPQSRCGTLSPAAAHRRRRWPRTWTKTQGWPGSGVRTPTPPPTLPPQPEHTLLAGQGSRRSGGGRGVGTQAPGLGNGRGDLPIPALGGIRLHAYRCRCPII